MIKRSAFRAACALFTSLVMMLILVPGLAVCADGSAVIDVPEGTQQGSSVTVYVTVSCDSNISFVSGSLDYDEVILQFESSDFASGGGGVLNIPGAFPDSPSQELTMSFNFSALEEGDAPISFTGYAFDSEGTVIADISQQSSVTVGGTLPDDPDSQAEPDDSQEPEQTTTVATPAPETEAPEQTAAPDETAAETVTEADLSAKPRTDSAIAMSQADSSSPASLEKERSDLAKKLTVPLLIILAVLIIALVIITVWIKNRMKKK